MFGLSIYAVHRRTKEIGIRKVLGATISNVIILLSGDFIKLVLIAGTIAVPIAYYGVILWLEGYSFRLPINFSLFTLPVIIVTFLTAITISFKTINAAMANPVDSIKYE